MKARMKKLTAIRIIAVLALLVLLVPQANAQAQDPPPADNDDGSINSGKCNESEVAVIESLSAPLIIPVQGNYVAAGTGLRGQTSGAISISGIPATATVVHSLLYWGYLDNGESASLKFLTFNGTPITGTKTGSGLDTCWGRSHSHGYRADVTSLVPGNATYSITGVASGGSILAQGASLVVVYSNPVDPSRTIVLIDGDDVIEYSTSSLTNVLSGFTAASSTGAKTTFIVGDGQAFTDSVSFTGGNGTLTVPNPLNGSDGGLWDTDTYDVSAQVAPGDSTATVRMWRGNDCLMWVAQVFSVMSQPPDPLIVLDLDAPDEVVMMGARYHVFVDVTASSSWPDDTVSIKVYEDRGPINENVDWGIHDNEWCNWLGECEPRPDAAWRVYVFDYESSYWKNVNNNYVFGEQSISVPLSSWGTGRCYLDGYHRWYWIPPWSLDRCLVIALSLIGEFGHLPAALGVIATGADFFNGQHDFYYTYTAICQGPGDSDTTTVRVPVGKYILLGENVILLIEASLTTAAALIPGPHSLALAALEAAAIITGEVAYHIASDPPDFQYTEIAVAQIPDLPGLDQIKNPDVREAASKALELAAVAIALQTSVERYEGAKINAKPQYMALQLEAWRFYAQRMVELTNWLADFWGPISTSLRIPTPEEIQAIRENLEQNGLPELEVAILSSFGYSPEQMTEIADTVASLPNEYFTSPGKIKDALYMIVDGFTEHIQYIPERPAQVALGDLDMGPEILNLKSKGKWITCYIEFTEEYDVSQVSLTSLVLQNAPNAEVHPSEIGDYDNDGVPDLMVKFDRQELIEILGPGEQIVALTGQLSDGTLLASFDVIRVKSNKKDETDELESDLAMSEEIGMDLEDDSQIMDFDSAMPEEFIAEMDDDASDIDTYEAFDPEEAVGFMLFEADEMIGELDPKSFKNEESAFELACALDDVFTMLDEGMYFEVMVILEGDIIKRMDGYANIGQPDEDDWVTSIEGQALLYPLVIETIELLESLL